MQIFDVKNFGASGHKEHDAQPAIQAAINACASAGGGVVYVPPGEYTTGTIELCSHLRFYVEAGATIYSSKDKTAFHKESLLFGEDLENITIEGRGTFDGQAAHEWRLNDMDDRYIIDNQRRMEALGRPLMRAFPSADSVGKLVLLLRCKNLRIQGLSFLDSPFWTMHLYGCERVVIDGLYIRSSRNSGVWADGIDPDGCRDVHISNCTIDTGDDALVFYSYDFYGPALPCENITVTNCRLSSASSALKFCDGNKVCVRNVTVDNCIITDSNRGIAFMVFDGGYVSDVVISNMTIECRRYDWFWWGDGDPFHFNIKRRSEIHDRPPEEDEPEAGMIRNVLIQNVIAHGKGPSVINGHPQSWLEGLTMKNIKLFVFSAPDAPYEKTGAALTFRHARHVQLEDIEVKWETLESEAWHSALYFDEVQDLDLSRFKGRQAPSDKSHTAIRFHQVSDAAVRYSQAARGTETFLHLSGENTNNIVLHDNDLRYAQTAFTTDDEVSAGAVEGEGMGE